MSLNNRPAGILILHRVQVGLDHVLDLSELARHHPLLEPLGSNGKVPRLLGVRPHLGVNRPQRDGVHSDGRQVGCKPPRHPAHAHQVSLHDGPVGPHVLLRAAGGDGVRGPQGIVHVPPDLLRDDQRRKEAQRAGSDDLIEREFFDGSQGGLVSGGDDDVVQLAVLGSQIKELLDLGGKRVVVPEVAGKPEEPGAAAGCDRGAQALEGGVDFGGRGGRNYDGGCAVLGGSFRDAESYARRAANDEDALACELGEIFALEGCHFETS